MNSVASSTPSASSPTATRRALLIDDEPLARLELRRLLKLHPSVTIVAEAGTMQEAREVLGRPNYDLVFLDVQLRGGTGFDLLDHIAPGAQLVFVTAFDRYAVRAFEVNALDYVLKPVTSPRLALALQRLTDNRNAPVASTAPGSASPFATARLAMDDRAFVKTGGTTRFVPVADIGVIKSCENYTELFLADGQRLLVLRPLKAWEETLPESHFLRVHRQALVNLAHVKRITRTGEDDVLFELTVPLAPVPASRRQVAELKHRFAAAGLDGLLP
jgi:two-component system LytT family response regulator